MTRRASQWYTFTIVAIAAAIRLHYLNAPMRVDESYTFLAYASAPWAVALSDYTFPNNHLLNTALIKLCTSFLDNAPWVIRLPALLAGLALVPATAALARRLYGSATANVAAALTAWSPPLILYSVNARGHIFVVLATVLSAVAGFDALRTRRTRYWIAFAITSALGFYAVPTMLYPFGAIVLWLAVLARRHRQAITPLIMACLVVATLTTLLYTPVIMHSGVRAITGNQYVMPESWASLTRGLPAFAEQVATQAAGGLPAFALAIVASFGFIVLVRRDPARAALFPITIAWSVILLLITHRIPFVRVWLYLTPLALVLAAAAVGALVGTRRTMVRVMMPVAGVTALLMAASAIHLPASDEEIPDAPAIARALEPVLEPGDLVISVLWADAPVRYYLTRAGVPADRFATPSDQTSRVFIVVQRNVGFDFAKFASVAPMFSPPHAVARFDRTAVYLVRRSQEMR